MGYERVVLVTRRTRLQELIDRFNTHGQAKFYIEHAGGDFADYEREHDAYGRALDAVRRELDLGLPLQVLDRPLITTYIFSAQDVVVTLGQDGLVANVAKYAGAQPIVGVNPDPERFDGVLLPFRPHDVRAAVTRVLSGRSTSRHVTLAEARLTDGQRLLAFNDLFVGMRTHTSARYRIRAGTNQEAQSSSGVLVSTGAGSTGWMSSVFNMAAGVTAFTEGGTAGSPATPWERQNIRALRLEWEDRRLIYAVREPFVSRHSAATVVAGLIEPGQEIVLESFVPSGGVIFSDGVESDFLEFNAGAIAQVRASEQQAVLVAMQGMRL
jgi:NAD kinase